MGCCNARNGLIVGALIGAAVAILGGILIPVGEGIIKKTVEKEAVLENGTTAYENWISTGVTVYRQFWVFNVTNPAEVLKNGATPVVSEIGPYTYKTRFLPKDNISFTENFTVSFVLPAGAIFEPLMSVGPEEDVVTCLNLVVAGTYSLVPKELQNLLDAIFFVTKSSLFQRRTVKELLWGYRDPIIQKTTGLFADYNGSIDGLYSVFTGKDDISKVGIIKSWREDTKLNFWDDQYCDMLNGTDASSFPPFVDKNKPLYFFSSDICRSASASFERSLSLRGIEVYRFTLHPDTLAAPSVNPDNHCFCKNMNVTQNCTLAGALDISSCQGGYPIYISLPHFLYGSEVLRENVLGLNPIQEQHMTHLDVEPLTGFTLGFSKRIQMNLMYGPSDVITMFKKVKNYTIFPIVWLNETAMLDQKTADIFKEQLVSKIVLLENLQYSLLGVGLGVFVLCLIGLCFVQRRKSTTA